MESLVGRPSPTLGVKHPLSFLPLRHHRGGPILARRQWQFVGLRSRIPASPAVALAHNGALAPQSNGVYTVGDFMTKKEELHVVKPTTSVDEALEMLVENRITGFPVIDDDWNLVGVVSDYDLLALDSVSGNSQSDTSIFPEVDSTWKTFNEIQKLLRKIKGKVIGELMTSAPLVVRETTNLEDAARLLLETKYRRLPVVDSAGKLVSEVFTWFLTALLLVFAMTVLTVLKVGIITRGNVVRAALHMKHAGEKIPASAPAAGDRAGVPFSSTSLYVGDLDWGVTDAQLYEVFSQMGMVMSVRVCRDINTRRSLGYAYVNYAVPSDAARAIEMLNLTPLNGKTIRVMYSIRDPSIRKSGTGNVFVKNLEKSVDSKALHETFSAFGTILSCKIVTDTSGLSKGYGFVQFHQEESAQSAIEKLNGTLMNNKKVYVRPFIRKQERENAGNAKFNNVFVKNLSESTTEDNLQEVLGVFGTITSCVVMRERNGKSKGFGFINYANPDAAAKSVQELNGKEFDGKEWYVGKAQKKSERKEQLKEKYKQTKKQFSEEFQRANLYLKNLDYSIGEAKLIELFSPIGAIASCKVMRNRKGSNRGCAFVAFHSHEDASKALSEMNGKMVGSKPLYADFAKCKEDTPVRLQLVLIVLSSRVPPVTIAPHVQSLGGPGLGQPSLVPGVRPVAAPFYMPMAQQGQHAQYFDPRYAGLVPVQQPQHTMPMVLQMQPWHYPPAGYGMHEAPLVSGVDGWRLSTEALISALANAAPEEQIMLLGENLYPLVDRLEHEHAAKVTGMLLEMDQSEVLKLLESREALKDKVAEAMETLRNDAQEQQAVLPTDQIASLSLNDGADP
ncbi:hypothetical protein Cni_G06970 [Canna indica]|uniref:Polyadenylate-binding protein n=1 Tax=Canna indica TaxID=4628 RepID=A0AAQ3Q6I0_9LILI|nr:hypothetical protein Cni_G06970 [Canna indica]